MSNILYFVIIAEQKKKEKFLSLLGEYEAHLVAKDKDVNLVEIKMTVPFEDGAVAICEHWEKKNQDIY